MAQSTPVVSLAEPTPRPRLQSLWRGFCGKCANCGVGRMFRAFLKVADVCPHCGEQLFHQRADDAPAYFVILIVGHIVIPLMVFVEVAFAPPYWVHALIFGPLVIGLSLGLLQPIKGAIVAWQWACRMHGFGEADESEAENEPPSAGVAGHDRS